MLTETNATIRHCRTSDSPTASRLPLCAVALVLGAILLIPSSASAQFRICNRTDESVSVAMAYRSGGAWLTRGWFNAPAGECVEPISSSLSVRYYYVYAESTTGTWSGDQIFCIDTKNAFRYTGTPTCSGSRDERVSFTEVDTGLSLSYTLDLTPPVSAQDVHDRIEAVRVTWRGSFLDESTWVMQLHNASSSSVSFSVRCFTRNGGYSRTFPVTISGYGTAEIGFVEGWAGNFVPGEWCNAYHGDELVWRVDAGRTRRAT